MSPLDWIATVLGIACVALGAFRSVWTFPTAIGSVALVGWSVWHQHLYSDALLQLFFVVANLYGWANWARSRAATGAVAVERLSAAARWRWVAIWAVATLGWGAAMHRLTDAAYPWWDGGIAVASVTAQWLMARRAWENWALWILIDVASVPLYLVKQLPLFAALYLVYLLLSAWGLVGWLRVRARAIGPAVA